MSALSTVITLWDYVVVLTPVAGWVVVLWMVWRCSEAEEPRASFRRWMPAMVVVGCVSTALFVAAWQRQAGREARLMTGRAWREARAIAQAAEFYYYDSNEWPAGGNREVIATLMKPREDGHDAYLDRGRRLAVDGAAIDPWGRPYLMELRGEKRMRVWSAGVDGVSGTADDVASDR